MENYHHKHASSISSIYQYGPFLRFIPYPPNTQKKTKWQDTIYFSPCKVTFIGLLYILSQMVTQPIL
jgi:hypothetical protein